jgi:hypothetical protein
MRCFMTVISIIFAGVLTVEATQSSASGKVTKSRKQSQMAVTITGTLLGISNTQLFAPQVIPVPVTDEKEDATKFELTDEALNKYSAQVDQNGRFRLKLDRNYMATGKKLMILVLFPDNRGLQPLKYKGKNVVLDIDDKTTTINLGRIVMDK